MFSQLPSRAATKGGSRAASRKHRLLSFQKFHKLIWDVNHASGLEKVAEPKPTEVRGHPTVVAGHGDGRGAVLEPGWAESLSVPSGGGSGGCQAIDSI